MYSSQRRRLIPYEVPFFFFGHLSLCFVWTFFVSFTYFKTYLCLLINWLQAYTNVLNFQWFLLQALRVFSSHLCNNKEHKKVPSLVKVLVKKVKIQQFVRQIPSVCHPNYFFIEHNKSSVERRKKLSHTKGI